MLRLTLTTILVAGIGITGAVAQDYYGSPRGYYNNGYGNNNGYGQQRPQGWTPNGQRTTTVTVTNRGQNGYRDDVVQQQVLCGSTYYDGYRNRVARC
jgi:hypothetical protein